MTPYAGFARYLPIWLYKILAQLWVSGNFPRHIFVETSASCNLTCSYCPREKIDSHMDFELFTKVIDEATKYGARSFSLHLFGEPLIYPQIFEAIRYIKQRNRNHTVLLTTNGTKLNECVDDFISAGISQAFWTWRPEAKFTNTTLLKLKKWGKFRVRFIKEITPERAYKEWASWKNIEGRDMHNYGGEIDTKRWKKSPIMQESTEFFGMSSIRRQANLLKTRQRRWPCYHLWLAPAVGWNGNLLLCCADPHQKEVIGKFPEVSIAEAWGSEKMNIVRESHLRGKYEGICKSCDVWKSYPNIFFGKEYPWTPQ